MLAVLMVALLLLPPLPFLPGAAAEAVGQFTDGSSSTTLTFSPGGGWVNNTTVTLPWNASINGANVIVTPGKGIESDRYSANAAGALTGANAANVKLSASNLTLVDGAAYWGQTAPNFQGSYLCTTALCSTCIQLVANETWTGKSSGPAKLYGATAVWDTGHNFMIVFGGMQDNPMTYFNSTYLYRPSTNLWSMGKSGPAPRVGHTAVWDNEHNQMIVHGGFNSLTSTYYNDTWTYDPGQDVWYQRAGAPSGRAYHSAIWDYNRWQMLVYGGYVSGTGIVGDLWTFDLNTNTWAQRTGSNARQGHTAVWDASRGRMLVFGGYSTVTLDDLAEYNSDTDSWSALAKGPSARQEHTAVWDSDNGQMLVFGGLFYNAQFTYLNDTWAYCPANGTWGRKANGPAVRDDHVAVWDAQNRQMLVFGGYSSVASVVTRYDETWAYSCRFPPMGMIVSPPVPTSLCYHGHVFANLSLPTSTSYKIEILDAATNFSLQQNLKTRDLITVSPSQTPNIRLKLSLSTYDDRVTPMFFGWGVGTMVEDALQRPGSHVTTNVTVSGGLRLAQESGWKQKASGPAARSEHAAVWDSQGGRMIIYGGVIYSSLTYLCDTWAYYPSDDTWVPMSNGPSARAGSAAVWDPLNNQMLVHGGYNGAIHYDQLWSFTPSTNTWAQKGSGGVVRALHAAAWDSSNSAMLLFGGYDGLNPVTETYSYNPGSASWSKIVVSTPPGRYMHTAVWDSVSSQMLMLGGRNTSEFQSDIWAFRPSGPQWLKLGNAPARMAFQSAVWDTRSSRMLVFGGDEASTGTGDLRAYYPTNNTWADLTNGASPRLAHTAVWDKTRNQMVVYGGRLQWSDKNDTWAYSPAFYANGSLNTLNIQLPLNPTSLGPVNFHGFTPAGTTLKVLIRTSAEGSFWSPWEQVGNGASPQATPIQKFIQWRANLSTTDPLATPELVYVSIGYRVNAAGGKLTSAPVQATGFIRQATPYLTFKSTTAAVALRLSGDDGAHWQPASNNAPLNLNFSGTRLRFELTLNTSAEGIAPSFSSIIIDYSYDSMPSGILLTAGNTTTTLGNLNDPVRFDMAAQLRDYLAAAEPGPEQVDVPISVYSATGGTINLMDLVLEYTFPPPPNRLPSISDPSPSNGSTIESTDVNLTWNAQDPDGDGLNFTVLVNGTERASSLTTPSYMLHDLSPGVTYSWQVRASDGKGWADSPLWRFMVGQTATPNTPPNINLTWPTDGVRINSNSVNLTWTAKDAENDTLTFRLFLDTVDGSTPFRTVNTNTHRLTGLMNGTRYYWKVLVTDGTTEMASPAWRFTVDLTAPSANTPPVLPEMGPLNASVGKSFTYRFLATDRDKDKLTYSLSGGRPGMKVQPDGSFEWTPDTEGTYTFGISVTDSKNPVSRTYTIVVSAAQVVPPKEDRTLLYAGIAIMAVLLAVVGAAVAMRRRRKEAPAPPPERPVKHARPAPVPAPAPPSQPVYNEDLYEARTPVETEPTVQADGYAGSDTPVQSDSYAQTEAPTTPETQLIAESTEHGEVERTRPASLFISGQYDAAAVSPEPADAPVEEMVPEPGMTAAKAYDVASKPTAAAERAASASGGSGTHAEARTTKAPAAAPPARGGRRIVVVSAKTQAADPNSKAPAIVRSYDRKAPSRVLEAFLVYQDGRLVSRSRISEAVGLDSDLFSSMLTAVQSFVKDSMSNAGNINQISMGNQRILMERGPQMSLAVVVEGEEPKGLRSRMRRALITIWDIYKDRLKHWDGCLDGMEGVKDILRSQVLKGR